MVARLWGDGLHYKWMKFLAGFLLTLIHFVVAVYSYTVYRLVVVVGTSFLSIRFDGGPRIKTRASKYLSSGANEMPKYGCALSTFATNPILGVFLVACGEVLVCMSGREGGALR